jgi:GTPase Era involved in 16S rRNA processing
MSAKNIVVFGETGAGISSLVNLIAGQEMAITSPDMERCTTHWKGHAIYIDGCDYKVFDTAGLQERQLGMKEYGDVIMDAYDLITKLNQEGRIDLLLYCVRAGAFTTTLQINYRLFYEWLCEKKVPIVLVLTGLEREQNMEDWWTRNERIFTKYEIHVADHACITAANRLYGRHEMLYEESRRLVRDLVRRHTRGEGGAYTGRDARYGDVTRKSWGPTEGDFKSAPKKQDIGNILGNLGMSRREIAKALAGRV